MDLEAKKAIVRKMRNALDVSDVFCTRILKNQRGSVLVGLTASLPDGTTLEEAEIATLILGERVDQLALDRAQADGLIGAKERTWASAMTKDQYHLLLNDRLAGGNGAENAPPKLAVLAGPPKEADTEDGALVAALEGL